MTEKKARDPARDRTWNLLLRRQAPYPLGQARGKTALREGVRGRAKRGERGEREGRGGGRKGGAERGGHGGPKKPANFFGIPNRSRGPGIDPKVCQKFFFDFLSIFRGIPASSYSK